MTESSNLQACTVCGRLFIKRPEKVCSMDCLKLTAASSTAAPKEPAD